MLRVDAQPKMRVILDENVHADLVELLTQRTHDVQRVAAGTTDTDILAIAVEQNAVLVTYDRDFGELVFGLRMAAPPSIIYSRLGRVDIERLAQRLSDLLQSSEILGKMVVLSNDGVRLRAFPNRKLSDA